MGAHLTNDIAVMSPLFGVGLVGCSDVTMTPLPVYKLAPEAVSGLCDVTAGPTLHRQVTSLPGTFKTRGHF